MAGLVQVDAGATTTHGRSGQVGASPGGWAQAVRLLGLGVLTGTLWGVLARVWMRYVSDAPAFTWSGTLFIVGLAALAGLALAAVELLRRRGARTWRVLLALPALVMFAGPGMLLLPSAVLGGLAVSGRGGRWVQVPAALLALAPVPGLVALEGVSAFPNSVVASLAWYLALSLWLALGWSLVFRRRQTPRAFRADGGQGPA